VDDIRAWQRISVSLGSWRSLLSGLRQKMRSKWLQT
jgi:hypothetical protein